MAWTFDAANTGVTEVDADSTVTYAHTTGTLTHGILFAWASWSNTAVSVNSVTYNGIGMTVAASEAGVGFRSVALYYILNPDIGNHNVVLYILVNY